MSMMYCEECNKSVDTDFIEWCSILNCCIDCYENMEFSELEETLLQKIDDAKFNVKQYRSCTDGSYELCLHELKELEEELENVRNK